ncbi:hypothetical protein [Dickeya chrysanthemi]|uniref:hypothetical protein n=1 Tax=Dickeya chrysanthemi TaxID=556 RepID=UPI0012E01607|nr:hypothetical protein [Dickeya chrysanthemi]
MNIHYEIGRAARMAWASAGELPPQNFLNLMGRPMLMIAEITKTKASHSPAVEEILSALPAPAKWPEKFSAPDGDFWLGYYHQQSNAGLLSNLPLSADELEVAGEALYGQQWQSALARDLAVDSRRIRHWISGERPIPIGIRADVAALCRRREKQLSAIAERLTKTP